MLQTNPRDFIALLEVFRIGVTNRIVDVRSVIEWADAIIEHDATPDDFVVELAMCGSKNSNDLVSLLNQYIGEHKPNVAGRAVLGLLYHEYTTEKIDLYRVVRTIDWLVLNGDFTEIERSLMSGIDDAYMLAAEGIHGSVTAVADYVLSLLSFYQNFRLENPADWSEINKLIFERVFDIHLEMQLYSLFK